MLANVWRVDHCRRAVSACPQSLVVLQIKWHIHRVHAHLLKCHAFQISCKAFGLFLLTADCVVELQQPLLSTLYVMCVRLAHIIDIYLSIRFRTSSHAKAFKVPLMLICCTLCKCVCHVLSSSWQVSTNRSSTSVHVSVFRISLSLTASMYG